MTEKATTSDPAAVVVWRTSSRSTGGSNGSNCVEVGTYTSRVVAIRDSKAPHEGTLTIDSRDWTSIVEFLQSP